MLNVCRLSLVGIIVLVGSIFVFTPGKAEATKPQSCNPTPSSWGTSVSVAVELIDKNGTSKGFAEDFTFLTRTYQPWYSDYSDAGLPGGVVQYPGSKGTVLPNEQRHISKELDANNTNTIECFGINYFKFDVADASDFYALDCYYNPGQFPGYNGVGFEFSGVAVRDVNIDGDWTTGVFEKAEFVEGNVGADGLNSDLNKSSYTIILKYKRIDSAKIKAGKYIPSTHVADGNYSTDANLNNSPISIGGSGSPTVTRRGATSTVNVPVPEPAFTQIDTPAGYKLVCVSVDRQRGTAQPTVERPKDCNSPPNRVENLVGANGDTIYVNYFYDPDPISVSYFPWLQTVKGDVETAGELEGQRIGVLSAPNENRGARHGNPGSLNTPNSEAEYVIAAAANGSKSFCSLNEYTLGTNQANIRSSCAVNKYDISKISFDDINTTISDSFKRNGSGNGAAASACKPYNTKIIGAGSGGSAEINVNDLNNGCVNGAIYKKDGDMILVDPTPGDGKIDINGRGTVWVNGKLTINTNINYVVLSSAVAANRYPNMAIFVNGDVEIDQTVERIDAIIIATGKIKTCSQSAETGVACERRLIVNGYLASDGVNDFGRRFINVAIPNNNSAELIKLTGQSILFPPPGLGKQDSEVASQLQFNLGELPPRLN